MVFFNDLQGGTFLKGLPMQEVKYIKHCEAEIIFGVQSQNCSGNGICQMFPKGTLGKEKQYCHSGNAQLLADFDGNLILKIQTFTLRSATLKKHFRSEEFRMEENFELPSFVQKKLAVKRTNILKGTYSRFSFDQQEWIFFPVEK